MISSGMRGAVWILPFTHGCCNWGSGHSDVLPSPHQHHTKQERHQQRCQASNANPNAAATPGAAAVVYYAPSSSSSLFYCWWLQRSKGRDGALTRHWVQAGRQRGRGGESVCFECVKRQGGCMSCSVVSGGHVGGSAGGGGGARGRRAGERRGTRAAARATSRGASGWAVC